jgi:hypothetical protein
VFVLDRAAFLCRLYGDAFDDHNVMRLGVRSHAPGGHSHKDKHACCAHARIRSSPDGKSTSAPTDIWLSLLEQDPFPYTTALPPLSPTELDGLYAKLEPSKGTPVPCRRCPDYLPEGGVWKLSLDDGAFRIFHPFTGWHSLGSFTVSGRRFVVSNDPACYREVGVYTWTLHGGRLSFDVLDDACQVGRRARSFASMPWAACQPPSTDAAVTAQWASPPGCKDAK